MKRCIISANGMTSAMKIKSTLEKYGVTASVQRLPYEYSSKGCSYGVVISRSSKEKALKILTLNAVSFVRFIETDEL